MYDYKLGIVGAGNMANAILNGILRTGVVSPEKIVVSDIDDKKLEIIKNQGVNTVKDNKVLFKNAEFIILAVKPQVAKVIFRDFEKIENLKIISIMAGITKDTLKRELCRIRLVFWAKARVQSTRVILMTMAKNLFLTFSKASEKLWNLTKNILTRLPPSAAAAPHTFILS